MNRTAFSPFGALCYTEPVCAQTLARFSSSLCSVHPAGPFQYSETVWIVPSGDVYSNRMSISG
jgi:hypothetical protein